MVSTRKKRQSNRRLLSQLDDFDQDMIIGNAAGERQENVVVKEGTNDRDFTVGISSNNSVVNENAMNVKILERCFIERIDREMSNIVDTVEDRIQNAILTAIDNIVAPEIELAIRPINASSGRDATSVSANSERREHVGINTSFENASGNNNTLGVSNVNDETRHNIPDEVSELSVPETQFDRQAHTHHLRFTRSLSAHPREVERWGEVTKSLYQLFEGWCIWVLAGHPSLIRHTGRLPWGTQARHIQNGLMLQMGSARVPPPNGTKLGILENIENNSFQLLDYKPSRKTVKIQDGLA